jgi:transcriptional regulator with XRE-family HTH domain
MEERNLPMVIAENLRLAMRQRGIENQAQLSRETGVPYATLNLYLNPERRPGLPNLKHLVTLAEFFRMEVWELLCPMNEAERALLKSFEAWVRASRKE